MIMGRIAEFILRKIIKDEKLTLSFFNEKERRIIDEDLLKRRGFYVDATAFFGKNSFITNLMNADYVSYGYRELEYHEIEEIYARTLKEAQGLIQQNKTRDLYFKQIKEFLDVLEYVRNEMKSGNKNIKLLYDGD